MSDQIGIYYSGRYPAVVTESLPETGQARVSIPRITDGAKIMLLAEIEYPVGCRSVGEFASSIELLEGDPVWIEFIGGDGRYPIITGSRNPNSGNEVEWRRIHHANIEVKADGELKLIASDGKTSVTMSGDTIVITADADVTVSATGNAEVTGASITLNGDALGGCVGELTPCQFSGAGHVGASATVKVGA